MAPRSLENESAGGPRERLVLVGNGMAGARVLEELVARGGMSRYAVTVLGEEPTGAYNRVLLSGMLNGTYQAQDLLLQPAEWYARHGITLHAGDRVTAVDRGAREVRTESGRRVPYDRLVLATGSRAALPALPGLTRADGARLEGVFVFRTLEDCRAISAYGQGCRRALVLGGGLLGLEAACGLRDLGLEVTILQRGGHLMDRQLDTEGARVLEARIRSRGVEVRVNAAAAEVRGERAVTGLVLADGTELPCELLVLACGIQPNVELARECGLPVARGILVDDQLRTEDPHIRALGECAEHRGMMYGLVAPLWEQAAVLARSLLGEPGAAYGGSRVTTRLKVVGIELTTLGSVDPRDDRDEVVQYAEPQRGIYQKLLIREGRLVGAILLGDGDRAPYLTQLWDRGGPLPSVRASLLFDLGGRPGSLSPEEMPDEAVVCHCNGVRKGDLRECLAGGARGFHEVVQATRACTGCGSCKPLVRTLIEAALRSAVPSASPVGAGS